MLELHILIRLQNFDSKDFIEIAFHVFTSIFNSFFCPIVYPKQGTPVPFVHLLVGGKMLPQTPVPRTPSSCGCASFCEKTLFSKTISA